MAYLWRNDNEGPPESAGEVLANKKQLEQQFPGAKVVSSTLDEVVEAIKSSFHLLPVITRDLSDSWSWGVSSDPVKQMQMRAIGRVRSSCGAMNKGGGQGGILSGYCSTSDLAFANFSRLAIKNLEHTWGLSVGNYGNESDLHWSNSGEDDDVVELNLLSPLRGRD